MEQKKGMEGYIYPQACVKEDYSSSLEINRSINVPLGTMFRRWSDQKSMGALIDKLNEEKKAAIDSGVIWKDNRYKPSCLVWQGKENPNDLYPVITEEGVTAYLNSFEYAQLRAALNLNKQRHEAYFAALVEYMKGLKRLDIAEKIYYGFTNETIQFNYNLVMSEWSEGEKYVE